MSNGLMVSYDAYVSLKRIRDFLSLDNLDSTNTVIYQQEGTEKIILPHKSPDPQQATILGVRHFIDQSNKSFRTTNLRGKISTSQLKKEV